MMEKTDRSEHYFKNLDALRTIAFLMVFFEHVVWREIATTSIKDHPFLWNVLHSVFSSGELGVSIFFTLSGFLITYLIFIEKDKTGTFNIWAFYARRTLRIWPLYYAYVFFVFIIYPELHKIGGIPYNNPSSPLMQILFMSNFDSISIHELGPINNLVSGITWSLSIEEQFYLCWPILFLVIPKRFLSIAFISILLFSIYFRFLHYTQPSYISLHTFAVFGDLVVGGLSAYIILYNDLFKKIISNLKNKSRFIIYFLGFLYLLFKDNYLVHEYSCVYSRAIATFFIAFIILDQNFNESNLFKFGKSRLLTYWGKYTYGLYLLHPIGQWMVLLLFSYFDFHSDSIAGGVVTMVLSLIFSCMIAYLSYNYYEKYFLKLKQKFSVSK